MFIETKDCHIRNGDLCTHRAWLFLGLLSLVVTNGEFHSKPQSGRRWDLMDKSKWNLDYNESFSEYVYLSKGPSDEVNALVQAAETELMDMGLSRENILGNIEHTRVDKLDTGQWEVKPRYGDPVINMLIDAFVLHKPVTFSPDLIYGYIAKGFALYIKKHSEKFRNHFVSHKGKKELKYKNNAFVMGNKYNQWEIVFERLSEEVNKNIKYDSKAIVQDVTFTTSTTVTEAHRHVLAMEAMEKYFDYTFITACGIPSVTILGEISDWEKLYSVVDQQFKFLKNIIADGKMSGISIEWWQEHVQSMLQNMIKLSSGNGEDATLKDWLSRIFKSDSIGSGGEIAVSGWINILFPYIKETREGSMVKNPWFEDNDTEIRPERYPTYHASVPFSWLYHGQRFPMRAMIGHMVLAELSRDHPHSLYPSGTLAIFPGWIILHMPDSAESPISSSACCMHMASVITAPVIILTITVIMNRQQK